MSIEKKKLLSVGSLALNDFIETISNSQYEEYCKKLIAFVENFPLQEEILKSSFGEQDYTAFTAMLSKLREELKQIHATGLELSCRRLLDELGGQKYSIVEAHLAYLLAEISALSIDIQLAQSEGTHSAAAPPPAQAAPPQVKAKDANAPKSILAVDDVSLLLFNMKSILKNTEYQFSGVTSGESALKYVQKFTPDLFILDIEMPGMNGYELTKRLRKCGQTAPVIFLTGNASKEYVQRALEVGAVDFIVKPVNAENVMDKIRKHIG